MTDNKRIVLYPEGLTEYEINELGCKKYYNRAECCQRYYEPTEFEHSTLYNLYIEGVNTCIHCYFGLNLHKYSDNFDPLELTKNELACYNYYLDNYTKTHSESKCFIKDMYKKCILCDNLKNKFFLPKPKKVIIRKYSKKEINSNKSFFLGDFSYVQNLDVSNITIEV
jgi:hypothetical protein